MKNQIFSFAALSSWAAASLFDDLMFQNEGVVTADDRFTRNWFSALYLECENCTKPQYSWAIKGANYLFRDAPSSGKCYASALVVGFDFPGGDLDAKPINGNASDCAQRCCEDIQCKAYVFDVAAPAPFMDCAEGQRCCYLKNQVLATRRSAAGISSGTVAHNCDADAPQDGYDRSGGDLSAAPVDGGSNACATRCCGTAGCAGYVFATAPENFGTCKPGSACCYLKNVLSKPHKSGVANITTASVRSGTPVGNGPPIGMRSAVPLGGIGAGSFEIRADGSVKEVTIINQSPGGGAKMGMMDGLLFAVREGSSGVAKLLRTQPPSEFPATAAAAALRYQGAYPVSRLELLDPTIKQLNATMFALSRYKVDDLARSTTPAVALSLEAKNTGTVSETASFFVTFPLSVEEHYARRGSEAIVSSSSAASAPECLGACQGLAACVSWMWEAASGACTLMSDAPLGGFQDSVFSGVKGTWSQQGNCLTLNRPDGGPAAGNASLCAKADQSVSFATASSTASLYESFATAGELSNTVNAADAYGAMAITVKMAAGDVADLSAAISWYFPGRDYMNKVVGNFYATQYKDSADAANDMLTNLANTVQDISSLQRPLFESSLPDWLTDTLHNSVSHIRSAWFQSNGAWRQWEAYDCVNVDSIHNDGERHIPYIMFLPETTRNKMHAWGATQQSNGMLPEQLACGCMGGVDPNLDKGCGRVMSDVSSMYVVYLLELYKWANDTESVKAFWPIAKKAAQWHIDVAKESGVPEKQCNTYDILGPQQHKQVSYNSAFHLLAMRAAEELARSQLVNDQDFADECAKAFARGQQVLDTNQWVDRGKGQGYYSFSIEDKTSLMVDTFYPQVLSYTLGLGALVDEDKLQAHLDTELEWNDSPYGLIVASTGSGKTKTNGVWQMGPPNWASLNIHLGRYSVNGALEQPAKSLKNWRDTLKDLWNVAGIADQNSGLPSITSHYGYYMSAWHLPLAISGQQADLPKGTLSFKPKVPSPYALPLLLPGVIGLIRSARDLHFEVELTAGSLQLSSLRVGNCAYSGAATFVKGETVAWNCAIAPIFA
eukprot:TRINITY_DN67517_c0_g1_i1.p1 TRINITY_DN67517_c0_g1~~TRINITY_DN67517_c0_g1_i1.p1  ORF type:complete len:1064 (+),score=165.60 TRINITY_DN67517_c0_g1_i1:141-3332(+)